MSRIAAVDFYYLAVIGLVRLNDWVRSPALSAALGRTMGRLAFTTSGEKTRRIKTNLARVYGDRIEPKQLDRIARGSLDDFWREMLSWSYGAEANLAPARLQVVGLEHLNNALARGKGVVLWDSNGFGRRVLAKKLLFREGFVIHQIHGPNNLGGFLTDNPRATQARREWVKTFFDRREQAFVASQIDLPASDAMEYTRTMMHRLTANGILSAAGDGSAGHKHVAIDFLGYPTLFATGLVSMARLTGAAILSLFCFKPNDTIRLEIGAPLEIPRDMERDAAQRAVLVQYAARLEALVRAYPEQYRNWHLTANPRPFYGAR